jgi:hypothetical protein
MTKFIRERGQQLKIWCNTCKGTTKHTLIEKSIYRYDETPPYGMTEEDYQYVALYYEETWYSFWKCDGCGTCTLEAAVTGAGMYDKNNEAIYEYTYFPKRQIYDRKIKKFTRLPHKLNKIYSETINAFNNGQLLLTAAGLRAIIEGICDDKSIGEKREILSKKIPKMVLILPKNIVDNLHSFRIMGNMGLHELEEIDRNDLEIAIEVIEDLLNFIYDLEYKTAKIKTK